MKVGGVESVCFAAISDVFFDTKYALYVVWGPINLLGAGLAEIMDHLVPFPFTLISVLPLTIPTGFYQRFRWPRTAVTAYWLWFGFSLYILTDLL